MPDDSHSDTRFDAVDWESFDTAEAGQVVPWWLVGGVLLLVGGFAYDYLSATGLPVELTGLDWLLIAGLISFGSFVLAVSYNSPQQVRYYWVLFRTDWLAIASFGYLTAFFLLGLIGPLVVGEPGTRTLLSSQPPVWGSITADAVPTCAGSIVDGRCQGTWRFPLGTMALTGEDMVVMLVLGARTSLSVVLGAATIIVPIGVGVGVIAAAIGGRTRDALLWVAEQLQTLPAILVYLLLFFWVVEGRLSLLIAVFGLVGSGGLVRVVHDEIRLRQSDQYVQAAELGGMGFRRLLGRHLLPNLVPSVVSNVALQLPLFILIEASVSFVTIPAMTGATTLGDPTQISWGQLIYTSLFTAGLPAAWWLAGLPLLLLFLTVVCFTVVSDALVDALEPRG